MYKFQSPLANYTRMHQQASPSSIRDSINSRLRLKLANKLDTMMTKDSKVLSDSSSSREKTI